MPPLSELDIRLLRDSRTGYAVEFVLNDAREYGRASLDDGFLPFVASGDSVRDGARLFAWLTADPRAQTAWSDAMGTGQPVRIHLRIDPDLPELHALPWESLHTTRDDGTGFSLAASAETPFSRYLAGTREHGVAVQLPLRIAVAVAAPDGLEQWGLSVIDRETELAALTAAIGEADVELIPVPAPVTLSALEAAVQAGCHVLHIIGHGLFDAETATTSLVLADEENQPLLVSDADVTAMLDRLSRAADNGGLPRLIFLASCETAMRSPADAFRGLAPQLVQIGVPAVLAMQDLVPVETARRFGQIFYRRLLTHGLVDQAANEARAAILTGDLPGAAVPVLFMRIQDGALWLPPADRSRRLWLLAVAALTLALVAGALGYIAYAVTPPPPTPTPTATFTPTPTPTSTPTATPTPARMGGDFNVAVANFGLLADDGSVTPSEFGSALSLSIYNQLVQAYVDLNRSDAFDRRVEIWHDNGNNAGKNVQFNTMSGADTAARAASAGALAETVGADLVIYGQLTGEDAADDLELEFYFRSPTIRAEPDTAFGRHLFDNISVPISYAQDPTLARSEMLEQLDPRVRGLFWITVALVYDKLDRQEQAFAVLQAAEAELDDWEEDEGKELLYYFTGREAYILREFADAETYLDQALAANPDYVNALLGFAQVLYSRANLFLARDARSRDALGECVLDEDLANAAQTRAEADVDLANAIFFQEKALALAESQGLELTAGTSLLNLGQAYLTQGQLLLQDEDFAGAREAFDVGETYLARAYALLARQENEQFRIWAQAAAASNYLARGLTTYQLGQAGALDGANELALADLELSVAGFQACIDDSRGIVDPAFQRRLVRCNCQVYLTRADDALTALRDRE